MEEDTERRAAARRAALVAQLALQRTGELRKAVERQRKEDVPPLVQGDGVGVLVTQPGKNRGFPFWIGPPKVIGAEVREEWVHLP